jgi:hypothetical protein
MTWDAEPATAEANPKYLNHTCRSPRPMAAAKAMIGTRAISEPFRRLKGFFDYIPEVLINQSALGDLALRK